MPTISQLASDTVPNDNDLLVTVDVSAGTTKNITREDFFTGAPLPANSVDTQALGDTGWISFVSTFPNVATNNLKYRRIGGVVYLHGQFSLTAGNSFPASYTEIGELPVGFRPISGGSTRVPIATYQSGLSNLRIYSAQIEANGKVSIYPEGSDAAGDVRFNVSYPADN